jgi:integration host factor subunit beta
LPQIKPGASAPGFFFPLFKPLAVDAGRGPVLYRRTVSHGEHSMLRSELVSKLQEEMQPMRASDVEHAVDIVLDEIATALAEGGRVELRGFGAFSVRKREARTGRNPRTGATVKVEAKKVPFFKPGKELRLKVNGGVEP